MDFTGERYVPTMEGPLKYEHVHRYVLASAFAGGRTVLDLACGEGYGAAILASTGQVVVGVDADAEIVAHAADTYEADNLHFLVGACEAVPIADATFDLVTSFETIEHHDRHDEMLGEIKRLLKPGGVLIISSPSKVSYSDESGYVNPYHVRELYYEEFRRLLKKHFRNLRFFGQKFGSGSYVYPLLDNGENAWGAWEGNAAPIVPPAKALPNPFYFVAVCSDSLEIDRIDLSSAYLEGAEDTLSDWEQARIGATANPAGPVRREEIGAGPNFAEVDDLLAKLEKARLEKAQETLARRRSLHTLYRQSTGLFRTRVRHAAELRRLRDEASLLKTQLRETTRELEGYRRRWLDLEARASRPILRIFWDRVAARLPWLHRQEKSAAEPAAPLTADAAPSPSPYPEDTVGPMRGYLDYPREGESVFGTTAICGWVHSTAGPIVGIEVSIGDTVLGSIAHGTARPDVTAKLPDQPRASGFQGKVFISGHEPEGDAQLRIRASDAAGNVWVFTRELRIGYDAKLRGMLDPVADAGLGSAVGSTFIEISGWSFSVAAVTTVEAWIDDLYLGALHYGVARPDVVTSFPEAPLACGFRDTLFIGDLQLRGKKTLKVEIADADGNEARYTRAIIFPSPARWSAA